jgi:hypothetical protein
MTNKMPPEQITWSIEPQERRPSQYHVRSQDNIRSRSVQELFRAELTVCNILLPNQVLLNINSFSEAFAVSMLDI